MILFLSMLSFNMALPRSLGSTEYYSTVPGLTQILSVSL